MMVLPAPGSSASRNRRVAVGETANLVLLDLDARWTVTVDGFRSRSTNSWLLGETLRGRVVQTVADGRTVFSL